MTQNRSISVIGGLLTFVVGTIPRIWDSSNWKAGPLQQVCKLYGMLAAEIYWLDIHWIWSTQSYRWNRTLRLQSLQSLKRGIAGKLVNKGMTRHSWLTLGKSPIRQIICGDWMIMMMQMVTVHCGRFADNEEPLERFYYSRDANDWGLASKPLQRLMNDVRETI